MSKCSLISAVMLSAALSGPVWASSAPVNEPAPQFTAEQIDGIRFDLSQYQGKTPVLLKFWATWCAYCVEEMPHTQALQDTYGDALKVVTINIGFNDSVRNVNRLFSKNGWSLPVVFDKTGALTTKYGIIGTPAQVLIDRDGIVRYRTNLTDDTLEATIAELASR